MIYIQCPANLEHPHRSKISIFLAGGISNCPDWQIVLRDKLQDIDAVLINPRRYDFDASNKEMEREQITWEYNHLEQATAISFWFPSDTLCPITLLELGAALEKVKSGELSKIFIGCDPAYKRVNDVKIQTELRDLTDPVIVVDNLDALAIQIREWTKTIHERDLQVFLNDMA